jgi:hypothetical protein
MMAWLAPVWAKLAAWLALVAAVVGVLVGVRRSVKAEGVAEERAATVQRKSANMEKAHEADRVVSRLPDGAAAGELRRKWRRDDTH